MPEERISLPSAGSIPGIPGSHGAGEYLVDWEARTVRPFEEAPTEQPAPATEVAPEPTPNMEQELAHVEEELHTLESEQSAPQA